jgi:hypothetical protein
MLFEFCCQLGWCVDLVLGYICPEVDDLKRDVMMEAH